MTDHEASGSSTYSTDSDEERTSSTSYTTPAGSGNLADLFGGLTFGSLPEIDLLRAKDSDNTNNINFTASKEVIANLYDGVTYPLQIGRAHV